LYLLPLIAINFHGNAVDSFVCGVIMVTPGGFLLWSQQRVLLLYFHTKENKAQYGLVENITLWLENIAHCGTLWNTKHTFPL